MRELRPPRVPPTPDFRKRVEAMLRRAVRSEARVPRIPRFSLRWSTAPAGTALVALLAATFFLNLATVTTTPGTSLPHWTAPQTTVVAVGDLAPESPVQRGRHRGEPLTEWALIDGRFERAELRSATTVAVPPPTTVPQ